MRLSWSLNAQQDLQRLHAFLVPLDAQAAARVVAEIYAAAGQLPLFPQLGVRLLGFPPHDVRRLIVGDYELRYVLGDATIVVLNVWHEREDR